MTDLDLIRDAIRLGNQRSSLILALPAFRRALAKYIRCERPKTCCELGYHGKEQEDDPGQTHYLVPCGECDGCKLLAIVEDRTAEARQ
mgnify:CR=1 FL=1